MPLIKSCEKIDAGQILVLTFPLVGNYGVPSFEAKDEFDLPLFFESDKIHISGLIVTDYSADYSHWNAVKSLSQWLIEAGVPALMGVDTRRLTKRIRELGAVLGNSTPILPNEYPFSFLCWPSLSLRSYLLFIPVSALITLFLHFFPFPYLFFLLFL